MILRSTSSALLATLALLAALAVPSRARAVDEKDLLPVDQAFALQASASSPGRIELRWQIASGYYLYKHRITVEGLADGVLSLPKGHPKHDEFFGDVETYRTALVATYAGTPAPGATTLALKVKYQGCADVGVCYPPQMRTLQVSLPAAAASAAPAPADDLLSRRAAPGGLLGGAPATPGTDAMPLPPEQAFRAEAIAMDGNTLLLRFTPAPGYYLYRDKTQLRIVGDGLSLGAPRWPKGTQHRDEHFGDVVVYFDQVEVPVPVQRTHARAVDGTLTIAFQGCQEGGICYPVMTRTLPVSLPAGEMRVEATPTAASLAEDQRLANSLAGKQRGWALLSFFVFGLALAFTPCVLPMVPILSGLIAGRGERIGAARAFSLSTIYVLASSIVFTIAGVFAGLLGAAANLQAAMQNVWVLGAFALLFVVLALPMFGLFELQLPAILRTTLGAASDRQRGGSWVGVAAMGALSALIVGPCVAPPNTGSRVCAMYSTAPISGGATHGPTISADSAPIAATPTHDPPRWRSLAAPSRARSPAGNCNSYRPNIDSDNTTNNAANAPSTQTFCIAACRFAAAPSSPANTPAMVNTTALASTYTADSENPRHAPMRSPRPAIRPERIGTIGSTHGVNARPNPYAKNNTSVQPARVPPRLRARRWSSASASSSVPAVDTVPAGNESANVRVISG